MESYALILIKLLLQKKMVFVLPRLFPYVQNLHAAISTFSIGLKVQHSKGM